MPCLPSTSAAVIPLRLPDPIDPRVSRTASVTLRLGLLALAIWALRRELAGVQVGALFEQFGLYGWRHATLALGATVASFFMLGLIELLAVRQANTVRVPARRAMITAFVAHAFSQSIGLALLTGSGVRVRAYERKGVDAAAVGRISGFVTVTITLGLLTCGAVALLGSPEPVHIAGVVLPVRPVGVLLAIVVLSYLAWSAAASSDQIGRGRWRLRRPNARIAVGQIVLSSLDWLITGTVLFAVLPTAAGIGYWALLSAYLVAQTLAMVSHVPGGAGVLEAVVLSIGVTGDDATQRAAVIAALLMFRVVYYLLPLIVAFVVAGVAELRPRRRHVPSYAGEPLVPSVR